MAIRKLTEEEREILKSYFLFTRPRILKIDDIEIVSENDPLPIKTGLGVRDFNDTYTLKLIGLFLTSKRCPFNKKTCVMFKDSFNHILDSWRTNYKYTNLG